MCFDLDSRPPIEPIAGGAIDSEEVVLRAGDGGRFAGLLARAETPSGAAIIVLPDVRGLHPYYEELALRFAEAGVDALAIDYFGRTAGIGIRERPTDFDFMAHVGETRFSNLSWDVGRPSTCSGPSGRPVGSGSPAAPPPTGPAAPPGASGRSSRSASASVGDSPSSPTRWGSTSPGRSASTAGRSARAATSRRRPTRTGLMTGPGPGDLRWRRPRDPARGGRGLRRRAGGHRDPPRRRHLPGSPALLLRPQGRGLRRCLGRRVGAGARVRPYEHAGLTARRPTSRAAAPRGRPCCAARRARRGPAGRRRPRRPGRRPRSG